MAHSCQSNIVYLIINYTTWTQIAMRWRHDLCESLNSSLAYKEPYRCIYGHWINGDKILLKSNKWKLFYIYKPPRVTAKILYHVGDSMRLQRPCVRNIFQTFTFILIHKMNVQGNDGKFVCGSTSMRSMIYRVNHIAAHVFVFTMRAVHIFNHRDY